MWSWLSSAHHTRQRPLLVVDDKAGWSKAGLQLCPGLHCFLPAAPAAPSQPPGPRSIKSAYTFWFSRAPLFLGGQFLLIWDLISVLHVIRKSVAFRVME